MFKLCLKHDDTAVAPMKPFTIAKRNVCLADMKYDNSNTQSHPEVVEGVSGVARVVNKTVSSIVPLRKGNPELWVDVLHKLSSVMHRLDNS